MYIFIDESGLFVKTALANSFSAVVAYIIPESKFAIAMAALRRFKKRAGRMPSEEVKASSTTEENYFYFLTDLARAGGFVTGVVSDGSMQGDIANHKAQQADKIDQYVPAMVYEEGKAMVAKAAADIRRLSDQNYVELHCRAQLAWGVICRATLYYSQREPKTLGAFRWSFDAKDIQRNHFESTMADILGTLTQSHSIEKPLIQLEGADYSYFQHLSSRDEGANWVPRRDGKDFIVMNGKIFHEHMEFSDSKASHGIQIADLLANGLVKCLKGRFVNNDRAASLLGSLMIREPRGLPSLDFVMFDGKNEQHLLDRAAALRVKIMDHNGMSMIAQ